MPLKLNPTLTALCGAWVMELGALSAFDQHYEAFRAVAMAKGPIDKTIAAAYGELATELQEIAPGVMKLDIKGVLLTSVPWWAHGQGFPLADLREIESVLMKLAADPGAVSELVLDMDSPGGAVAGTGEAANAIRECRKAGITVTCKASGYLASGAYWLAAACDRIEVTDTTRVGSIGVYTLLVDDSEAINAHGVKLTVVSDGGVKGKGADGVVDEELIAEQQKLINGMASLFRSHVQRTRSLTDEQMSALTPGAVWLGKEAANLGLVDAVVDWQGEAIANEDDETDDNGANDDETTDDEEQTDGETPDEEDESAQATEAQQAPAADDAPPAPTAANVDVAAVAELIGSHPAHALTISELAAEGATREEILGELLDAETAARAKAEAEASKQSRAANWAKNVAKTPDPGSDDSAEARAAEPLGDAALKAEWAALPAAKQANYLNKFSTYAYARRNGIAN